MRHNVLLNKRNLILILALFCACFIVFAVPKARLEEASIPTPLESTSIEHLNKEIKTNQVHGQKEHNKLTKRVIDDDGDLSGDKTRVFVYQEENGEWFIVYLWMPRSAPKALKSNATCIIDGRFQFNLDYKLDPHGANTHLMRCPLPESVRLKRPLTFDLVATSINRTWNYTLTSKPPPEKPLFFLTAYIRLTFTEFPYIHEWIEWQLMMGVEHIWVYDNSRSLAAKQHLKSYVESGDVTIVPWQPSDAHHNQISGEMHFIYRYAKHYTEWLLMADADEFMYPIQDNDYISLINNQIPIARVKKPNFTSLRVRSVMYLSFPRAKNEPLVTSKFLHRNLTAYDWGREKNFFMPKKVTFYAVHYPTWPMNTEYDLDWRKVIRMNHYWGRDLDRRPDFPLSVAVYEDEILTRFTPNLRKRLLDRFGKLPDPYDEPYPKTLQEPDLMDVALQRLGLTRPNSLRNQ